MARLVSSLRFPLARLVSSKSRQSDAGRTQHLVLPARLFRREDSARFPGLSAKNDDPSPKPRNLANPMPAGPSTSCYRRVCSGERILTASTETPIPNPRIIGDPCTSHIRSDLDQIRSDSDQIWIRYDLDPIRIRSGSDPIWIRSDLDPIRNRSDLDQIWIRSGSDPIWIRSGSDPARSESGLDPI